VVERPRIVEELELALGQLKIEWIRVPDDSWTIGRSIADCQLRKQTGISVIAILREPEPIAGAQAEDVIQRDDVLVVVGKEGQYAAFRRMLVERPAGV
jgi:TrkA domain protein